MAYRVTLVTYDQDAPEAGTKCKVYDCTTMEQALDYVYMQQHDVIVNVNIGFVGRQAFSVPT